MTSADRLIVALDGENFKMTQLMQQLYHELNIKNFKVSPSLILEEAWNRDLPGLVWNLTQYPDTGLFLDLKLYDTRDTIERTVKMAFDLGARFVTVHATQSVMEAAMRAKPADERCKVLAVPGLTDAVGSGPFIESLNVTDGIVCDVGVAAHLRTASLTETIYHERYAKKTLVCPGIRQIGSDGYYAPKDNHSRVYCPAEALRAGADYLIVGRPIWQAEDPAKAAKAIIAEMNESTLT